MNNQELIKQFEMIYRETYKDVLKYIISKCSNIDVDNDIIQETYLEMYKALKKKKSVLNYRTYLIGVAKNKVKDYINMKRKTNNISIFQLNNDEETIIEVEADIDIETDFIDRNNIDKIWEYIKATDKGGAKIFYLHFIKNMTFVEISKELDIKESTIKSTWYRMLKNMKKFYMGGERIGK